MGWSRIEPGAVTDAAPCRYMPLLAGQPLLRTRDRDPPKTPFFRTRTRDVPFGTPRILRGITTDGKGFFQG